jgi:hypothetical protein
MPPRINNCRSIVAAPVVRRMTTTIEALEEEEYEELKRNKLV